ncbi:MAG TPA: methyltransferase domain-containing protein [Gammaproteobacteria bacterium]|nr:methyltransferase domain-containing protein [Gammaproteobacteria bacterium]
MAEMDEAKLHEFVGKFVEDLGAVAHASTVLIGDRLGLYRAMAECQPMSSDEVAERAGIDERYAREWLAAQAASGYVEYDADTGKFRLPEEQAYALTDEYNHLFIPGGLQVAASMIKDVDMMVDAFRSGRHVGWHEHDHDLYAGTERIFRPNYLASRTSEWIPALDAVEEKLERGARVADVGCGRGASTVIMAQTYPNSTFQGFDYHDDSIEAAREAARRAGVAERCRFEVGTAKEYPGSGYDLVAVFDCLHDMGDPAGAAAHVRETLSPDGTWMIVEPFANDALEENLTPVGRIYYSASTTLCTPNSKSQEVGLALGAQAGEARIRQVTEEGGFHRFRRAAETPFNIVYEARP